MAHKSAPTDRFVGTIKPHQTTKTRSIPAIVSLQRYSTHEKTASDNENYICTLCWRKFEKPCYTVGSDSRTVCVDCWRWMYDLSICWACGEIVFRKEDAVRFGWCWWHWGCFSCLVCHAPLMPPSYLDLSGKPHTGGICHRQPPVCNRCVDLPDSVPTLEQHAAVMKLPETFDITSKPVDWKTPRVSIFQPLLLEHQSINKEMPKSLEIIRQKPGWMSLLPSNRNSHIRPPRHSALQRRPSFPYFCSTRYSSPFSTPAERPTTQALNGQPLPAPTALALPSGLPVTFSGRYPVEWPSSTQLLTCPACGNEITVKGAASAINSTLEKPSPALTEPDLLTTYTEPSKEAVPILETLEKPWTAPSSPVSPLISSFVLTPIMRQQSSSDDHNHQLFLPTKLGELSRADGVAMVPDPARRRPAYFKELSSFIASRDAKLILPSRALEGRLNTGESVEHEQRGSKSSPTLIGDANGMSSNQTNIEKSHANKSDESLNALAGQKIGLISVGYGGREPGILCKACQDCPCRINMTKSVRRRLVKGLN